MSKSPQNRLMAAMPQKSSVVMEKPVQMTTPSHTCMSDECEPDRSKALIATRPRRQGPNIARYSPTAYPRKKVSFMKGGLQPSPSPSTEFQRVLAFAAFVPSNCDKGRDLHGRHKGFGRKCDIPGNRIRLDHPSICEAH